VFWATTAVAANDLCESWPLLRCFQGMDGSDGYDAVLSATTESRDLKSALEVIDITFIFIKLAMSLRI
jgi:hypothetical protein